MAKGLQYLTATIPNAGTTSDSQTMPSNKIPLALYVPSALTGTTFTFQASWDATTFTPVYLEGTQYSVTVGTSRHVALDRRAMEGVKYFRIVSGSTEGAARSIGIVVGE